MAELHLVLARELLGLEGWRLAQLEVEWFEMFLMEAALQVGVWRGADDERGSADRFDGSARVDFVHVR